MPALSDLLRLLDKTPAVHVRIAAVAMPGETLLIHTLLIDVLPEAWLKQGNDSARGWDLRPFSYAYQQCSFVSQMVKSDYMHTWLSSKGDMQFPIPGVQPGTSSRMFVCRTPDMHDNVLDNFLPSHAKDGFDIMPWPHTNYQITCTHNDYQIGADFLVAPDAPIYPSFETARRMLLCGVRDMAQAFGQPQPSPMIIVRQVHPEAYIHNITVSPTSVTSEIWGSGTSGTRLSINGSPEIRAEHTLISDHTWLFPLPQGLPAQTWITLDNGSKVVDYAILNTTWTPFSQTPENITVEYGDVATHLEEIRVRGEGVTTEFKEAIPKGDEQFLKTVVAFANGAGGVFLIGVRNGTGELIGVKDKDGAFITDNLVLGQEIDRITNMIQRAVYPAIMSDVQSAVIQERTIIAVFVNECTDGIPRALDAHYPDKNPKYYVRRGACTFFARPEEIPQITARRFNAITPNIFS